MADDTLIAEAIYGRASESTLARVRAVRRDARRTRPAALARHQAEEQAMLDRWHKWASLAITATPPPKPDDPGA